MKFLAAALVFLCAAGLAVGKVIDYQKLVPLASINLAALGGKVKHLENADAPIIKKALHAAVEGTVLELHFLSHEDSVVNQPAAGLAGGVVCTTNAQSPETWLAIYVALLVAAQKNSVCHMHPKNKCNALKDLLGAKVELCGHPYKLSLGCEVVASLSVDVSNKCGKAFGGKVRSSGRSVFAYDNAEVPAQVRNSRS